MTPPPGADTAGATASLPQPSGDSTFVGASQDAPTAGTATANGPIGQAAPAAPTTAPTANALTQMPPGALDPAAGTINGGAAGVPRGNGAGLSATPDNVINAPAGTTPGTFGAAGAPAGGIIGAGSSGGVLGSITGFVSDNPLLSYGLLQAGGQLISGLTSTLTPAQVSQLNAQAAANQAAANLTTQQTQNLAQPKPVASLAPVTGTPNNIITPPSAGIINSAPPVNVTGVPA